MLDERARKDMEYTLREKMQELNSINELLKEKGTKPLFHSNYNSIYGNYKRMLEEQIADIRSNLMHG